MKKAKSRPPLSQRLSTWWKKAYVLKESIAATILMLLLTYIISFIPYSLEYAKGLPQGFAGFDLYDLSFSGKHHYNNERDEKIVLVEIADTRSEIANQVKLLSRYAPKIIAIDAFFESANPNDDVDPFGDINLSETLKAIPNVVLAYREDSGNIKPNIFFNAKPGNSSGYANFNGDEYSTIREYAPFAKIKGKEYQAFTSAIVKAWDVKTYEKLRKESQDIQLINYTGNLESYLNIQKEDLVAFDTTGQLENLLSNKIILVGYFMQQRKDYMILSDLHYTPMNDRFIGKSYPDAYGVVIHANILSMIINDRYATQASSLLSYLFAFLFTLGFFYYILSIYYKKRHPNHGILILMQLVFILILLYLFLQLYHKHFYKVQLEPIMISMVLALEMMGIYKTLALWLHKKFGYKTIFNHSGV